jgi:hypothetical protein
MNVQKLLCIITLFGLTACQPGLEQSLYQNGKPFQTSSNLTSITGKVEGWSRGVQKIGVQFNSSGSKILSEGTIDASGQFRVDLPTSVEDAALSTFTGCAGMTVTADFRNGVVPLLGVLSSTGSLIGVINYGNYDFSYTGSTVVAGTVGVAWMYSTKNNSARGTCPGSPGMSFTNDVDVKPGWNSIIGEYTTSTNLTARNGQTSQELTWRFTAR